MKVWLSTEINRQHRSEKGRATAWRHDRRGHGSHVVMPLHDFDRANDALLGATSDGERLVVHPVHDGITATANRQGGRPPLTMMADRSPRPTKRSSSPTHRSLIHQSVRRSFPSAPRRRAKAKLKRHPLLKRHASDAFFRPSTPLLQRRSSHPARHLSTLLAAMTDGARRRGGGDRGTSNP